MKKIIKYTMFFFIALTLSFMLSNKVYAETCENYTYSNCPDNGSCLKDPNGSCYTKGSCDAINNKYSSTDFTKRKKLCESRSDCKWTASTNAIQKFFTSPNSGKCESKVSNTNNNNTNNNIKNKDITDSIVKKNASFKCSDVKYLTSTWMFLRIVAPFILVLFASLDFFKSMVASDEKKMKESRGRVVKRLIAFFLLIILPFVIQFIFERIGTYGSQNTCLVKCIVTNNTSSKGCD